MTAPTTTHPYFTEKARSVFATAGGDPSLAGDLAAWAESAVDGDSRVGVMVAEDGRIVASTRYVPDRIWETGVTYVTSVVDDALTEAVNSEVGFAVGSLRRLLGVGVIHVKQSQVCRGPGAGVIR